MTTLGWTCHTRAAPSCDMFNLGSSYFHVALTTVRHLLTDDSTDKILVRKSLASPIKLTGFTQGCVPQNSGQIYAGGRHCGGWTCWRWETVAYNREAAHSDRSAAVLLQSCKYIYTLNCTRQQRLFSLCFSANVDFHRCRQREVARKKATVKRWLSTK